MNILNTVHLIYVATGKNFLKSYLELNQLYVLNEEIDKRETVHTGKQIWRVLEHIHNMIGYFMGNNN